MTGRVGQAKRTCLSGGPWELPEGWEWKRLGDVCLVNPSRPSVSRSLDSPTSFVPMAAVDERNGRIDLAEVRPYGEVARGFTYFEEGDVLFAKITPCMQNGKAAVVRGLLDGIGFGSTEFHVVRPGSLLTAEWIHAFLRRLSFRHEAQEHFRGAVGQQRVPAEFLAEYLVPVPPTLDTQRRIVARIDELLTEVREARRLLGEMVRDIDWLLPAAFEEFICVETRARTLPLAGVATAFNGRASGEGTSLVRVFKTKHVYPHALRMDRPSFAKAEQVAKFPRDRFLRPGDVLMANIAEGTLGRVTYVPEAEEDWTVDTQVMILRPLDERRLLAKWLYYYLWSARGQQEILSRRSGIAFADKRGQTHIYPKNVLEIPVPVPSIDRQREAVAVLDSIRQQSSEARQILAQKSTRLCDGLCG